MSDFLAEKIIFVKIPNQKEGGLQQNQISGPYFQQTLDDLSKIIGADRSACLLTPTDIDLYDSLDYIYLNICDETDIRSNRIFCNKTKNRYDRYRDACNEICKYLDEEFDIVIIFVHEDFAAELPYFFSLDKLNKPLRTLSVQDYGYHIIDLHELSIKTVDNMIADCFGKGKS